MDTVTNLNTELSPGIALVLLTAVIILYVLALIVAFVGSKNEGSIGAHLKKAFDSNRATNIGIPGSGLAFFVLVASLWKVFPPSLEDDGSIELKVFGLAFTGPSGPITLWVFCFLSFVLAIKVLSK
ncbi:MAG: hypothetical protein ACRESZ_14205 [Methylococcales bacterium]